MKQKKYLNLIYDFKEENKIKIIDRFLNDTIPSNTIVDTYLSDLESNTSIDIESIILSIKILISKENSSSNEYRELFRYRYNINKESKETVDVIDLLNYSTDPISSDFKPLIRSYIDYNKVIRSEFYQKIRNTNISIQRIKGIYVRLTYIQRNKKFS